MHAIWTLHNGLQRWTPGHMCVVKIPLIAIGGWYFNCWWPVAQVHRAPIKRVLCGIAQAATSRTPAQKSKVMAFFG